jgi:hypothetical protein
MAGVPYLLLHTATSSRPMRASSVPDECDLPVASDELMSAALHGGDLLLAMAIATPKLHVAIELLPPAALDIEL